jgi:hypothetical protein
MRQKLRKGGRTMAPKTLAKPRERVTEEQAEGDCVHYWVIDPPEGPISKGVCKICGDEKEFKNYVPYSPWEKESAPLFGLGIGFDSESHSDDEGKFIFVENKKRRPSW